MKKQVGLSLIELLVGMTLALVIIGGIIQVFISNRQAYHLSESMIRVQESGRFAVSFISETIRNSGSYGCVPSLNSDGNNVQSLVSDITDINAVQTVTSTTTTSAPDWTASANGATGSTSSSIGDTDRISLLQLSDEEYVVSSVPTTTSLITTTANDFEADSSDPDYVLVSNCEVADLGYVTGVDSSTNTVTLNSAMRDTTFSRSDMRSTIAKINHISFTVDETNENLTVEINGNSAQTVVGGIENVQFEYGVDTDGDLVADYFADISSVVAAGDEDDIAAVKISVLAVSGNSTEGAATNIVTDPQTFTFDGTDITLTSDNRYRAVFNSTVVLRNRMN
jgi:type IV pilus assembly protein PilW